MSFPSPAKWILCVVFLLVVLIPLGAAQTINISMVDYQGVYHSQEPLNGTVFVTHDIPLNPAALLSAFIDLEFVRSVALSQLLEDPSFYTFMKLYFNFTVTRFGETIEMTYPQLGFQYQVSVFGMCGGEAGTGPYDCNPTGWPGTDCNYIQYGNCTFGIETAVFSNSTSVPEALKFLRNATADFPPFPPDTIMESVRYGIYAQSPPDTEILLTTFRACGEQEPPSNGSVVPETDAFGWINMTIYPDHETRIAYIPGGFNDSSLGEAGEDDPCRSLFVGIPIGGVYKDGAYLSDEYVSWDGLYGLFLGRVQISQLAWDHLAEYRIVYLPRNGPRICAFTNRTLENIVSWNVSANYTGNVSFDEPFSLQFNETELENNLSAPECGGAACVNYTLSYDAEIIDDYNGSISFIFYPANLTATATTDHEQYEHNYTDNTSFSTFGGNLAAPASSGNHTLDMRLFDGGEDIASGSLTFSVCTDADGDGFCYELNDCNDTNHVVHPNGIEVCNGVDDDCDGGIDEGLASPNSTHQIGDPCGVGAENSLCQGQYVCTSDGENILCHLLYIPGQEREVCENGIDDDCDGFVDEDGFEINGTLQDCGCANGANRTCGTNVGACQTGIQLCINNEWDPTCLGSIAPATEVCNQQDDDCDGVVDDVGGGSDIYTTACQCYGNQAPQDEVCNDRDDDCNGIIDDGIRCCTDEDVRECGSDVGMCEKGLQTCVDGSWGSCTGARPPSEEICDGLDNNCDGDVDETCDPDTVRQLCSNGYQDQGEEGVDCGGPCTRKCSAVSYVTFIAIAVIVILVIVVLAFFQLRGSF